MVRVIHVGVGGRGKWPVNLIKERNDFKSVAFVDINKEALNLACSISGLDKKFCFEKMEDALKSVEAEAVIIITPPQLHAKQCLQAIKAGKHVLVEKPFTMSFKEAKKIVEEADKRNVKICVVQNARYSPLNITLAKIIKEKIYGKPSFGVLNIFGWRPKVHHSGEVIHSYLWERGVHDLDTLRAILHSEPVYVSGYSFNPFWSPYRHGAGVHSVIIFENEISFGYTATFSAHSSGQFLRIECEKASLQVIDGKIYIQKKDADKPEILTPEVQKHLPEEIILDGFYNYITKNIEVPFSGRENLKTIAFVEAIGVSSDKLKTINVRDLYKDIF